MEKSRNVIEYREHTKVGECHVSLIDDDTGELVYDFWEKKSDKKAGRPVEKNGCGFVKLYRTNALDICKNKKLDFNEAGLLFLLLPLCGWQTPYLVDPQTHENMCCSDLARLLGKDRSHMFELLERLCRKGIIAKISRGDGIPCHYMMNTNLAFFGNTIDDTNHVEIFRDCAYAPKVDVKYRKTPEVKK